MSTKTSSLFAIFLYITLFISQGNNIGKFDEVNYFEKPYLNNSELSKDFGNVTHNSFNEKPEYFIYGKRSREICEDWMQLDRKDQMKISRFNFSIATKDDPSKFVQMTGPLVCSITKDGYALFTVPIKEFELYMQVVSPEFIDGVPIDRGLREFFPESPQNLIATTFNIRTNFSRVCN